MSAIYESISTTSWSSISTGANLTITKPTGLAVGDYMVAHITKIAAGSTNVDGYNTPGGWTSLEYLHEQGDANSSVSLTAMYKIADSGDVAASNFSFQNGSVGTWSCGSIYRISNGAAIDSNVDGDFGDTTPTHTNTVTPLTPNSVLLFLVSSAFAGTGAHNVSGYAVTTDNPTWTERAEVQRTNLDGTDRGVHAGATAVRTATSATGDSTCAISQTQNNVGCLVYIAPPVGATGTFTHLEVTPVFHNTSPSSGVIATHNHLEVTPSFNNPIVKSNNNRWNDTEKGSKTWTDTKK